MKDFEADWGRDSIGSLENTLVPVGPDWLVKDTVSILA